MGKYILAIILGYLIGNFATSMAGKLIANIDIRNHAKRQCRGHQHLQVLGPAAGTIVFIGVF